MADEQAQPVKRGRARVRNPVREGDGDRRHGKPSTYTNHGCRCERCTTAVRLYQRNGNQGEQYGYRTSTGEQFWF